MDPGYHQFVLCSAGDDPLNVLDDVFFVVLKYSATFPRVITPCGEESGGELVVLFLRYLADEGKLALGYLVSDLRDVVESVSDGSVGDALLFDLHDPEP